MTVADRQVTLKATIPNNSVVINEAHPGDPFKRVMSTKSRPKLGTTDRDNSL